jgi:hypothetical protein
MSRASAITLALFFAGGLWVALVVLRLWVDSQ